MKNTLKRLDSAHQALSASVKNLDPALFPRRPGENEWSVAEVVHHLCLVEERVLKDLTKSVQGPPANVSPWKKLIPMRMVSVRFKRFKAPKAVEPLGTLPKDELLNTYDEVRSRLKQFCADHGTPRLRKALFKHPFFGDLDGVAAVSMVAFHEQRHNKQIREIVKKLTSR
jgi:hypothetical protein